MERLIEQARAALIALPPGPWTAYGTTVYAGSTVVAQAGRQGPTGERTAQTLALLPDLIRLLVTAAPDTLLGKISELEAKVERLEDKIVDLGIDLEHAKDRGECNRDGD